MEKEPQIAHLLQNKMREWIHEKKIKSKEFFLSGKIMS